MDWNTTTIQQPRQELQDLEEVRAFLRTLSGVCAEGGGAADPRIVVLAAQVVIRRAGEVCL